MKDTQFTTPILLLAFNRPDFVQAQIQRLKKLNAQQIFVAVDGPRPQNAADISATHQIQELVQQIDWCTPQTLFRKENLGCKRAVSSGIDWFFQKVEKGIILEDDCIATDSFFTFCQELLELYKKDSQVMHISGANFLEMDDFQSSYYFSVFPHCWGWATWRRAWQKYDVEMPSLHDQSAERALMKLFPRKKTQEYWLNLFHKTASGEINTWDYQWILSCWLNEGLTITPKTNLVSNQGFDARATHTKLFFSPLAHLKTKNLSFPLAHPLKIEQNKEADKKEEAIYEQRLIIKLLKGLFRSISRNLSL
jgi:hypothetical protein